jgi:hypothetical protein
LIGQEEDFGTILNGKKKQIKPTIKMFDPTAKNEKDLPLYPNILPYGHSISAPAFRPDDQKAITKKAVTSMNEQVEAQLKNLKEQYDLIRKQVNELEQRRIISIIIYEKAKLGFSPVAGDFYHLYRKTDNTYFLSIISPEEWGRRSDLFFVASVRLFHDDTWKLESVFTNELKELYDIYLGNDQK